jgi:SAM-dependent methyltransferase
MSRCHACGLVYRTPIPTDDDLSRIYSREYYTSWGIEESHLSVLLCKYATFAIDLEQLDAEARKPGGVGVGSLLDVGCAAGYLMDIAAMLGWKPHGLEVSSYSADLAARRFGAERVFAGPLTRSGIAPESFEAMTMTDMLEHTTDVNDTLAAAWALLRPGGLLLITTPRLDSWSAFFMRSRWPHFKEEHVVLFTRDGLSRQLERAGFELIAVGPRGKYVTLDYLLRQMLCYESRVYTPLARQLQRAIPTVIQRLLLPILCGEMRLLARKRSPVSG